jgi:hypothetical protein
VDPKDDATLISFQRRLEAKGGRYFLDATQLRTEKLDAVLKVYKRKDTKGS